MKSRIAAATAAVLLAGLSAGPVLAQGYERHDRAPVERFVPASPYDDLATGSVGVVDGPLYDRCLGDSAAEGNANQQNRAVKQYGQTASGPRC